MNEFTSWHNDVLGERTVAALVKNRFKATYCKTSAEAAGKILEQIPEKASVGIGGSWTVMQMGLLDKLAARGNEVLNHGKPGLPPEEAARIEKLFLRAGLPVAIKLSAATRARLVKAMQLDKKVSAGEVTLFPFAVTVAVTE